MSLYNNILLQFQEVIINYSKKNQLNMLSFEEIYKYLKSANYIITKIRINLTKYDYYPLELYPIYRLILFSHDMKCSIFILNDFSKIENIISWNFDDIVSSNILLFKNNNNITTAHIKLISLITIDNPIDTHIYNNYSKDIV